MNVLTKLCYRIKVHNKLILAMVSTCIFLLSPTIAMETHAFFVCCMYAHSLYYIFYDSSWELSCVTVEYALQSGLDILVGTPGRILDHMHRGTLNLKSVKYVIM